MKSYDWSTLDEAGKYEVWSEHLEAGGAPFTYPGFCNLMDSIYQVAQ